MTSFVGRRREVAEVKGMLSDSRLVTLVGVGGGGKTRLALRVAQSLKQAFSDGVWFVELASLEDPELLTETVSIALGIQDRTIRESLSTLAAYLRDKQLLLVLDNGEHVRTTCAVLADTLLRTAPSIRILATGRQALGLTGEHCFQVPTLSVPSPGHIPPLDALDQYEAIRLFTDRSAAVQPGFALTTENHETVTRICQRLEGIPLAIELTAVRLRALSLEDILVRLEDRYRLLTKGSPGALPRHQTLRTLIDWSHDLCSVEEQLAWARLSVFSGSFDLDSAEDVCSDETIARSAVLDLVTGLVEKSIVTVHEHGGHVRYSMLETIRQYGQDKLRESGSEHEHRRKHQDYFTRLVERAGSEWAGPNQESWYARLHHEHSNIRTALEFTFGDGDDPESGLRLASGLWYRWIASGLIGEGRRWLDRGLQLETRLSANRAKALWVNGYLCLIQEDLASARPMIAECAAHAEQLGDINATAWIAQLNGMAAMSEGELTRAVAELENAVERHGESGEFIGVLDSHFFLVAALALRGDRDRAAKLCEQALALCEDHGEQWLKSYLLWDLGLVAWQLGDAERAEASVRDALRLAQLFHEQWAIAFCIEVLAWTAHASRQNERAARLLGSAESIWERIGATLFGMRHLITYHDECLGGVHTSLGSSVFDAEFLHGSQLGVDEAISSALGHSAMSPRRSAHDKVARKAMSLTSREQQVAELVAQGLSNKDIASNLVIAPRTAEAHVEHVLNKLGFSSRTQIAAWVAENRSS